MQQLPNGQPRTKSGKRRKMIADRSSSWSLPSSASSRTPKPVNCLPQLAR